MGTAGAAMTRRQSQIVERVARGATSKEIGAELGVTERAVKAQLTRLYGRFGAQNRAGLIATVLARPSLVAYRVPDAVAALSDPTEFVHYADAPFLVAVTRGPTHIFAFVNERVLEVMGPPGVGMIGRPIAAVCPDPPERIALMDAAYASGEVRSLPNNRIAAWGGEPAGLLLNTIFQPLRLADGPVGGLLMICTDTQRD